MRKSVCKSITLVILVLSTFFSATTGAIAQSNKLDISTIEKIIGIKGVEKDGQYKITVPQYDLDVSVDGFRIIPPMGMGSWVAFAPAELGAMIMGDVVVLENEIGSVQKTLMAHGLQVTALHNHFVRESPNVKYMHIGGMGPVEKLARGVRAVLDRIIEIRGDDPAKAEAQSVENTLDVAKITAILGHEGTMSRGVYKITIDRPDVKLMSQGVEVDAFMGFNTWAAWQGTPEKAAVAGDFAMLADEVAPVIEALVSHDIEVVAVHNHMVHENPRIFFLHYWGVGLADKLAEGLKAALAETGKKQ